MLANQADTEEAINGSPVACARLLTKVDFPRPGADASTARVEMALNVISPRRQAARSAMRFSPHAFAAP